MPKILEGSGGNYPKRTKRIKKRVIKGVTDKEVQNQDGENMEGKSGGNWYELDDDDRAWIRKEVEKHIALGNVDFPDSETDTDEECGPYDAEEIDKMMREVAIEFGLPLPKSSISRKESSDAKQGKVIDMRSLKSRYVAADGVGVSSSCKAAAAVDDGRPLVPSDESDESVYGPSDYEYEYDTDYDYEEEDEAAAAAPAPAPAIAPVC